MIFGRLRKRPSFERIRVRILSKLLFDSEISCVVVAFTSRLPGEGVSTVVAGLAYACGEINPGNVLVLDVTSGHRRRRRVTDLLKVKPKSVDEDEIDVTNFDPSNYISGAEKIGIDVLTLAYSSRNELKPGLAKSLLDRLRVDYRIILMDAGSLVNSGGLHWLAGSDLRILVIDSTNTTREMLEREKKELDNIGLTLHGSILNKRTFPIPRFLYWLVR